MTLGNQQGLTTDSRTITLGGHQQVSKFVTEFFVGNSLLQVPLTGLVFISSNLPIGVVALAFTGFSFASLPVATQITVANVTATNVIASGVTVTPVVGVQQGIAAVAAPPITPAPTLPNTVLQLPSTFPGLTPTTIPITTPITGAPPVTAVVPVTGTIPLTGNTATLTGTTGPITGVPPTVTTVPTSVQVLTPSVTVFPLISAGVGGPGAQLLPQVATGAGWVTQITIANTSGITQTVRVDFFNPFGSPLTLPSGSTVENIVVAPTGVATVAAPAL
jgi:hypothetical protein